MANGQELQPTGRHRLFSATRNGWVRTSELRVGESLRTRNGEVQISALDRLPGTHRVYNLEVETDHSYFAGSQSILAHNDCGVSEAGDVGRKAGKNADDFVDLTGHRKDHILNRHRAGAGRPGKTEFPADWSDDKILHEISDVATDPAATRAPGRWGAETVSATRDGVEITVDMYPPNSQHVGKISTGYPTNAKANP